MDIRPIHEAHDLFNRDLLIRWLLPFEWQHRCLIIPDYVPPSPRAGDPPKLVIAYHYDDGDKHFLRYSKGPAQGHSWDSYGDDYQTPELALMALAAAPPPPRIGVVLPISGSRYVAPKKKTA